MFFWRDITTASTGSVLTIGNFDGVHLGHQRVLQRVKAIAKELQTTSMVILFEPQPAEFFQGDKAAPRLTTLRDKLTLIQQHGIDAVLCLRFNAAFSSMTAIDFVQRLLLDQLQAKAVILGDDFAFGRSRTGGYELLQSYSELLAEEVAEVDVVGHRVSSTLIRQLLAVGDFALAEQLLGRPYSISGHVAHGDQRGRQLGFPTANIYLRHQVLPLQGVYAVKVHGLTAIAHPGVANIGNRPTVDGLRNQLEVHILDFQQDIYGERISVEFKQKIRDEVKFNSLAELQQQIAADKKSAQSYGV